MVVRRLEEAGLDSLHKLEQVGVEAAVELVISHLGARAWANRRRSLQRALAEMR